MIEAPVITVNGIKITPEKVSSEVQCHPVETLQDAKYDAMQALVVRELLIQRSVELGLCTHDEAVKKPDDIFEVLFEKEIEVSKVDEEICIRFYDDNKDRFYTSPLFEVSHILYSASYSDREVRDRALQKANKALNLIKKDQDQFEFLAKTESACSSSKSGGYLGQITKGQTTPAFEVALLDMQEGDVSSEPISSELGYHLIKVHKRLEGKQLPFDAVQEWIVDYLEKKSWQRVFGQYIQLLAGKAEIRGFQLKQTDCLFVQ